MGDQPRDTNEGSYITVLPRFWLSRLLGNPMPETLNPKPLNPNLKAGALTIGLNNQDRAGGCISTAQKKRTLIG